MNSEFSLNIKGELRNYSSPIVMGILNVTPDSFYAGSRKTTEREIVERARQIVEEGGAIVDLGAYSSRPGADNVCEEEEKKRLANALRLLNAEFGDSLIYSIDTFRADVARMCVEEYGAAIINDISGGMMDDGMFDMVARLNVPYIMMHMKGTPADMQLNPVYDDLFGEIFRYFSEKIERLNLMGVNDIILDPGFGFGKTLDDNYRIMSHLEEFAVFKMPLLVGISRKSMIYRLLDSSPEESLNGTSVLNTIALLKGADIIRVHDVKAAVETVAIVKKLKQQTNVH